jgi:putative transposase
MIVQLIARFKQWARVQWQRVQQAVLSWTKPVNSTLVVGVLQDLPRRKADLMLENALLRQQLIVLERQVKRPALKGRDRLLMVLLASKLRTWKQTVLIIQPDTILRWHRELFKWVWRRKSKSRGHRHPLQAALVALIKRMVVENRLWGAERIRGELLKLGIRVSKRTIQKYKRQVAPSRPGNQTWTTFIRNHASAVWACDFVQLTDVWFRDLFAFFIIDIGSRRVVHAAVTRHPTDPWLAQQLREATPFGVAPRYLIRDNDSKFGAQFTTVAKGVGIKILKTPSHAPRANAFCERFIGSVRRECLNHMMVFGTRHLHGIICEYVRYFNTLRPHQGLGQRIPTAPPSALAQGLLPSATLRVHSQPVLYGLHHAYTQAA